MLAALLGAGNLRRRLRHDDAGVPKRLWDSLRKRRGASYVDTLAAEERRRELIGEAYAALSGEPRMQAIVQPIITEMFAGKADGALTAEMLAPVGNEILALYNRVEEEEAVIAMLLLS